MTTYTVIQEQIDRLCDAMLAKGLRLPSAQFALTAHEQPKIYMTWRPFKEKPFSPGEFEFIRGDTVGEIIAKAFAWVEALPSREEIKFKEFMGALGGVIDLGKENGIEVDFLNPLLDTMKRLSENALTDQRAA